MFTRKSCRGAFALLLVLSAVILTACSGSANVAGTYEIDKEAMKQGMAEAAKTADPNEPGAEFAASMMQGMIDNMSITLTLETNGSAKIVTQMMGQSDTATGTWTLDGKTISITAGVEGKDAATMKGTVSGSTITMHPEKDQGMPSNMVFKKKA